MATNQANRLAARMRALGLRQRASRTASADFSVTTRGNGRTGFGDAVASLNHNARTAVLDNAADLVADGFRIDVVVFTDGRIHPVSVSTVSGRAYASVIVCTGSGSYGLSPDAETLSRFDSLAAYIAANRKGQ